MNRFAANIQVLLLAAGCLYKLHPSSLVSITHSSAYLNAISNRLAASSPRSRLLGMVVGSAISELVDEPDKRIRFDEDEMHTDEVQWYSGLTRAHLNVGSLEDLHIPPPGPSAERSLQSPRVGVLQKASKPFKMGQTTNQKLIEEVTDSSGDINDQLMSHQKPDSDREDDDEDPTLVNRTKATPPV